MSTAELAPLRVTVIYSPAPRAVLEWSVELPDGGTVLEAMRASGLTQVLSADQWPGASLGVWGRKCRPDRVLRDGDRVEVYRPLQVDPKVARRERFRRQGARAAGLFARRQGAGRRD
jgi:putative ubiquitin-RnfH superfamily antitoxin RatB of RatAB toxin-antitoxin module